VAIFLLTRTLGQYSFAQLRDAVSSVPLYRIIWGIGFAAASYLCLTLFDTLGLRYAGKALPYRKAALTSFVALSLGHNIGMAALSSGAIRFRFYSRWGLNTEEVAKVILFCAVTVGLGLMMLGGAALLACPKLAQSITGIPRGASISLGALCLAIPAIYVLLSFLSLGALRLFSWSFELPEPRLAVAQLVIGPLNFALVAGCLYHALAGVREVTYPAVTMVYAIANTTTLFSHAPGGVGVIEWVVLTLLPGAKVVGGVLVFRCVYYFLPLCLGTVTFAASEALLKKRSPASRPAA
jgi:uncharacterized membrane protein YbhN (UPF0104 family)